MREKNTSGLAFPHIDSGCGRFEEGMTLRDYFAAKAMHQFLAGVVLPTQEDRDKWFPMMADASCQMADAMLKEREA